MAIRTPGLHSRGVFEVNGFFKLLKIEGHGVARDAEFLGIGVLDTHVQQDDAECSTGERQDQTERGAGLPGLNGYFVANHRFL